MIDVVSSNTCKNRYFYEEVNHDFIDSYKNNVAIFLNFSKNYIFVLLGNSIPYTIEFVTKVYQYNICGIILINGRIRCFTKILNSEIKEVIIYEPKNGVIFYEWKYWSKD